MLIPDAAVGERPHPDMPDEVKAIYEEARAIAAKSPSAAAALIRKSIEVLCRRLLSIPREEKISLYRLVGKLKQEGVKQKTIDGLEAVRVVGNNSVHPGVIDLEGKEEQLLDALFACVNRIVEDTIGERKEQEEFLRKIPDEVREGMHHASAEAKQSGKDEG